MEPQQNADNTNAENAPVMSQVEGADHATEPHTDADNHKVLAIVGYILPFLFFLPMLSDEGKKSEFAMFHANQHLILLIVLVVLYFLHSMFFMMFFMGGYFISNILNLAYLVLVILGVINAAQEKMKGLPLVGGFTILS